MTKKQKELVEQVKEAMQKCVENSSVEAAHEQADLLIIKLLEGIGLSDVSDLYQKVPKWFA